MNFDISVSGRPWKVAIEPAAQPGRYTVTVKGKSREIDVVWVDQDTLSVIESTGVAHEIALTRGAGSVEVAVGGKTFQTVTEKKGRQIARTASEKTQTSDQAATVKAPMPGRVVRVLVVVGDRVTARQSVIVVEAMKMENELRAPRDGVVAQVLVAPGVAVDSGAVLVVIE